MTGSPGTEGQRASADQQRHCRRQLSGAATGHWITASVRSLAKYLSIGNFEKKLVQCWLKEGSAFINPKVSSVV